MGRREGVGGQGDPEPGRRLGSWLHARLADLVGDAARSTSTTWSRDVPPTPRRPSPSASRPPSRPVCRVVATTSRGWSRCVRSRTRRSSRRRSARPRPPSWRRSSPRRGSDGSSRSRRRTARSPWWGGPPGPADAPCALLYSHHDVVPAGDLDAWSTPPWELTEREGVGSARGSADCKGNLVATLMALRAVRVGARGLAGRGRGRVRGLGGAVQRRDGGARPGAPGAGALRRLRARRHRQRRARRADPDDLAARHRQRAHDGATMAHPAHSGMYGGAAPDALQALLTALASLRDAAGETTIDGLGHDGIWDGAEFDEERFARGRRGGAGGGTRCRRTRTAPGSPTGCGPDRPPRCWPSTARPVAAGDGRRAGRGPGRGQPAGACRRPSPAPRSELLVAHLRAPHAIRAGRDPAGLARAGVPRPHRRTRVRRHARGRWTAFGREVGDRRAGWLDPARDRAWPRSCPTPR